jgi:RNA recognition motif-containing protein
MNCESLECTVGEGEANLRVRSPETFANFEQHVLREEIQMNIYVGNLSYDATDDHLREAFEGYGTVDTANVIRDQYSGRSRGFGFVEMPDQTEAGAAIAGLDGQEIAGRPVKVNEARPRPPRGERRGGGGGRRDDDDRGRW